MTNDAEIWRVARDLIADHGARRAEAHANRQLTEMTLSNDFAGILVWRRVLRAVKGLSASATKASSAGRR